MRIWEQLASPQLAGLAAASLSTNGVTGRPSGASAAAGEELFGRAVAAVSALVERGRKEEPPLGRAAFPNLAVPNAALPNAALPNFRTGALTWTP